MERVRRKEEVMVEVLKRSVLTRKEGNSTPSPTWKFGLIQPDGTLIQDSNFNSNPLSARKLGANLWEMDKNGGPNLYHHKEEKLVQKPAQGHTEQPRSGNNQRNRLAASMEPQNVRVKSLSSASYCSSMEVAPHRTTITPDSSSGSKGRFGKSSPGLKTSTELLKVLNRIWSLEEKHALDMSLVKTLRRELDQSQAQINELLQDKKRDQKEIDSLTKEITEYKVELKLRKHSEKLHEKLSHELLEMKKSFANALRESERERKARILLEDLCDEFAKGIRDYEEELRFIKQKFVKDQIGKDGDDRLLLHVSEAWLDERMQMKLTNSHDVSDKQTVLNKLGFEIESFLRAKKLSNFEKNEYTPSRKSSIIEHSLESFHLDKPGSAPWTGNDEDDSVSVGKKKSRSRNLYERNKNNPRRAIKGETMQRSYEENKVVISEDVDLQDNIRTRNCSLEKWTSEVYMEDPEISGSSSRRGQRLKPSTLKARLMEARVEGQKSRSKGLLEID